MCGNTPSLLMKIKAYMALAWLVVTGRFG